MRKMTLGLAAMLGLLLSASAHADLELQFSNVEEATIRFTGHGGAPQRSATVTFEDGLGGWDFEITNSIGGTGDAVGLFGNIDGSFSYSVLSNAITTVPLVTDGPLPNFSIWDGSELLTADLLGIDITQVGAIGGINFNAAINLTNVSYGGTVADLIQLRDEANANGGVATISYQFTTTRTLFFLAESGRVTDNSYSGTISTTDVPPVVPEPATVLMAFAGLPLLGLVVYRNRRRA